MAGSLACHSAGRLKFLYGAAALALACLVGCQQEPTPPELIEIEFEPAALRLEFREPTSVRHVAIRDEAGALLQQFPVAGEGAEFRLPMAWRPTQPTKLEIETAAGLITRSLPAPEVASPVALVVEAPLGQGPLRFDDRGEVTLLAPTEAQLPISVRWESRVQAPIECRLTVIEHKGLAFHETSPTSAISTSSLRFALDADETKFDARLINLEAAQLTLELSYEFDGQPHRESRTIRWTPVDPARLKDLVELGPVTFPADRQGRRQSERLADAVVMPNPFWSAMRSALGGDSGWKNFYEPYGYQRVSLRSHSSAALNVAVEITITSPGETTPHPAFAPPAWLAPQGVATGRTLLRLEPGAEAAAALPLFASADAPAGNYERLVRVFALGRDEPVVVRREPLRVVRGSAALAGVFCAAIAGCLAAWGVLAIWGRRWIKAIGVGGLARIAVVAALHAIVSQIGRLGGFVLGAALGPMQIFVAGLLGEGLTSLLLAVIVVLAPRPGVFTLSTVAVALLNALTTGQFGLVDIMFVTISFAWGEVWLATCGVTRGPGMASGPHAGWGAVGRVAFALGMANALTLLTQFAVFAVLHRLYFAPWYVWSVALVTGLVYGAVGAAVGVRWGYTLRRSLA